MALIFYYNDMLQKVTMQRTQQFSGFVSYRKNPVKCNACAVAQKTETDCFAYSLHPSQNARIKASVINLNLATNGCQSINILKVMENWA